MATISAISQKSYCIDAIRPVWKALYLYRIPNIIETANKEVQDTSCRRSGGIPQLLKSPKIGGYRGLIKAISAFS
jgi:hypothetical protein